MSDEKTRIVKLLCGNEVEAQGVDLLELLETGKLPYGVLSACFSNDNTEVETALAMMRCIQHILCCVIVNPPFSLDGLPGTVDVSELDSRDREFLYREFVDEKPFLNGGHSRYLVKASYKGAPQIFVPGFKRKKINKKC